ncbi:hypothetical protein QJS66_02410 [Kocuria rhizophila]|nr:hypothetical protein QJS66_02410 [Kocuria rhizophila]
MKYGSDGAPGARPTGAGKTTQTRPQHAGPDDVVIHLDEIRRTVGPGQASTRRMAAQRAAAEHKDSDAGRSAPSRTAQRADAAACLAPRTCRALATPAALAKARASAL